MVTFAVFFTPEALLRRGIRIEEQATVYCHELFGQPHRILGYTGAIATAQKIKKVLQRRYRAEGRLHYRSEPELAPYANFVAFPLPLIRD